MGINRTFVQGAGIALVLMGASASANEADDVRKAVMGHEAFLQRCMQETVQAGAENAGATVTDELTKQAERHVRKLCENYYKDINVCMPDGTTKAAEWLGKVIAGLDKILLDPLTRASDYDLYQSMKEGAERELMALQDMTEGRTNYCDAGQNES